MAHDAREGEDSVRLYLKEIGQYPLLDKQDEIRLAKLLEAGVEADILLSDASAGTYSFVKRRELEITLRDAKRAKQDFIQANLRLVVSIAKRYQGRGLELLDLIQEGNLGLVRAVELYDWRKGFKFSTYATWWIRQALTRGIANTSRGVRVPIHVFEHGSQLAKAERQLSVDLGHTPTDKEIAKYLEWDIVKVRETRQFLESDLSLDDETGHDERDLYAKLGLVDNRLEDAADRIVHRRAILAVLSELNPREREIIVLHWGLDGGQPISLNAIGAEYHLTHERIRQIEAHAFKKCRQRFGENGGGLL